MPEILQIIRTENAYGPTLKLGQSLMHHSHGSSSFRHGRSHPLDAYQRDVAYSDILLGGYFRASEADGKRPKRTLIWIHSQCKIASGEDEALIIKSDRLAASGIGTSAVIMKRVMGWDRTLTCPVCLLIQLTFFRACSRPQDRASSELQATRWKDSMMR